MRRGALITGVLLVVLAMPALAAAELALFRQNGLATKLANGVACASAGQCSSGFCVASVCCNTACSGACATCTTGTCAGVADGQAGSPSCTPYLCDGSAQSCPSTCVTAADCISGYGCIAGACVDHFTSLFTGNPVTECACANLTASGGETVTTVRGSAAFCTASTGVMTSCTNNLPRVSNSGLLVEGARTNLALRSQEMTNVVYTAAQDTGGTICTADTGQTAPDGTTTAESCAFSPGVGGFSVVFQTITGTAANYSASVYLKRSSGTSNVYLWWELGGAMVHQSVCAVTSSWTRCTLDNKTLTATGYRLIVGMANAQGHALVAQTLSVWGLQAELGAFSSSYIPTAGTAVARGAERFTFTPGQSIASAGCLRMTATFPPVYTSGIRLMEAASSASIPLYWDTSTTVRIYDGTNGAQLSTGALVGAAKTFRSSWGGSAIGVEMVGGGSASGSFDGTMNGTVFDLGSAGGSAVHLDRYLGSTKLGATAAGCQ